LKLIYRATDREQLRPIEDALFNFRAFALSQATYDPDAGRYDLVVFDRGLAGADEDPEAVTFTPEWLLRFNHVDGVSEPQGLMDDPYDLDIYQLDDVRYSRKDRLWMIKGFPVVEIQLSAPRFDLELYRVADD
jgi:hypothetical protein